MNRAVYGAAPGIFTVAEESTSWPGVSRPVHDGGLGFGFKWNMGFMHDTLRYMARDPVHRTHHHDDITFGLLYAFSENFVLPLSHDEVVHGKGSLLAKMPGDDWQKFANLRAYYALMWGYPGKKLLFMGQEFAQRREWSEAGRLDWHLLDAPAHEGVRTWSGTLTGFIARNPRCMPAIVKARALPGRLRMTGQFGLCLGPPGPRRTAHFGHRQYDAGDTTWLPCPAAGGRHLERDG